MGRGCCLLSREYDRMMLCQYTTGFRRGYSHAIVGCYADRHCQPDNRPHTLPPQSLYLAHLAPYLTSTQSQLEAELQTVQAENEQLAKGVEGQREEVEKLVSGLETVITDLEGANSVMEGVVVGGEVKREAMEVESELGSRVRGSRL